MVRLYMNKILIAITVIFIIGISAQTIYEGKFDYQTVEKVTEAASLKTRTLALFSKEAPKLPDSIKLDVPLINQMDAPKLYNGCEITSLAMILNFHGLKVTKNELSKKVKTVPLTYNNGKKGNPNAGFVGDMANGPGLGVYNGPVLELAQKYVGDRAVNLTNHSFDEVLEQVGQGLPVWIITTSSFAPVSVFQTWNTPQGKINITFSEHSVVITGYDEKYIYINNPYGEKNQKLNRASFIKAWEQMGKQAIVIKK